MARYFIYSTLKAGSSGTQVKALQESLPNWALDGSLLKVDGIFGNSTQMAVKTFQSELGLVVDGIVGEDTASALGLWKALERGFDSSHWNTIIWDGLPSDIVFANFKATDGSDYVDPAFEKSVASAKLADLDIGAYHFTKFANSPYQEAAHFIDVVSFANPSSVYLDLEYRQSGLGSEQITEWTCDFMRTVAGALPDSKAGIYTSKNYLREVGVHAKCLADYSLWAANWSEQPYVYPWSSWDTWQYAVSSDEEWAAGAIDLNLRVKS
jgi:GH25 family lysozyme M1 (1,4-beta-N-acetylmuramidase)